MGRLDMEKIENLVGGSDYCSILLMTLTEGNFQGSTELYWGAWSHFINNCVENQT